MYMCTHMHTRMYVCLHVGLCICLSVCMCMYEYACVHTYMCGCMCICVNACVYGCVCTRVNYVSHKQYVFIMLVIATLLVLPSIYSNMWYSYV